nr:MAG TPA: hypothetical protein [Caudoviricetes sp.]
MVRLIIKSFKSLRFYNLIILLRIVVQFLFWYKCLSITLIEILIEQIVILIRVKITISWQYFHKSVVVSLLCDYFSKPGFSLP